MSYLSSYPTTQFNQSGRLSNSQDGCQTNFRRYDP